MSMEKMFEAATRGKFRFNGVKGTLYVEDLWDLPLKQLDDIFKVLNAKSKEVKEESLLKAKTAEDKELETKIEIVKYIVDVKQKEAKAKEDAATKKAELQKVLAALAEKEEQSLKDKSPDELRAMAEALQAQIVEQ